jgi:uracil-DNA glycosylase
LFKWLAQAGWTEAEFRSRHYMASVTRCYPGKQPNGRGDRVPGAEEQKLCAPWREQELALLDLQVIIPVGRLAIELYFETGRPLQHIIGQTLEHNGITIVPLPHPSGASTWHQQPANQTLIEQAIQHLRHLREHYAL